jgi:hypothetical protein
MMARAVSMRTASHARRAVLPPVSPFAHLRGSTD